MLYNDFGFQGKEIAIMPTVDILQDTLIQNSEFFSAGKWFHIFLFVIILMILRLFVCKYLSLLIF